jgi:hypothetical protein
MWQRTMPIEDHDRMSLGLWMVAMFLLGMLGMLLCFAFLAACEKI